MPTLNYRVEAAGVNVLKTVTDEVVTGLLSEFGTTDLFESSVYVMSSFMASSNYSTDGVPTTVRNRCDVVANYIMDKSQVPWPEDTPYTTAAYGRRVTNNGRYMPVFIDPDAGVLIEQQTIASAIKLDFTLTFTSFDDATKTFDIIQSRYKGSLIGQPFHLAFSYPVSYSLYMYLVSLYNAKDGYKEHNSFVDYIDDCKQTEISFDIRKSDIMNPNADVELMIRNQQINCLVQFTMDQEEPDGAREGELPDTFKLSFSATIQFGRPVSVTVTTPVSVNNHELPCELFTSIKRETHYNPVLAGVYEDLVCNEYMRRSFGNFDHAHQLVQFPEYDDWYVTDPVFYQFEYRPLLIQHFTLDGEQTVIPLTQLGDIKLHPIVLDILRESKESLFGYGGLFTIGIYADDLKLGPNLLSIDDDLNITITSSRPDKLYHLVIAESTNLRKMTIDWDYLLIKYRYFFPLTIERNIESLISKRYFYIGYDNALLTFIAKLLQRGRLKKVLTKLVQTGEITNSIFSYTQNPSQLADYMAYTKSMREDYTLPTGTDLPSQLVQEYYTTKASVSSRSLLTAFIEQAILSGYILPKDVPNQYLNPSATMYPYYAGQGGYYGFNTPLRVINFSIDNAGVAGK